MHPKYSECKCVVLHAHHIATIGDGRNGKKKTKKKISEDTKRSNNKKRVHGNCMHIILLMNFPYTHCGPHIVNCVYSVCAALERKRKTIWRIVEAES